MFYKPTAGPIFKYLMTDDIVRNKFLSDVISEKIIKSKLLDSSLDPLLQYQNIMELLNKKSVIDLMKKFESSSEDKIRSYMKDSESSKMMEELINFVNELAPIYYELAKIISDQERNNKLNILCETDYSYINIEVQIEPKNFCDTSMLYQVCGSFYRQFPKGFEWSSLDDRSIDIIDLDDYDDYNEDKKKIRRTIGVSIFERTPMNSHLVKEEIDWYNDSSWTNGEVSRNYKLMDVKDNDNTITGVEFFDFNLEGYREHKLEPTGFKCTKSLMQWLDFLSSANEVKKQDIDNSNLSKAVKRAYNLIYKIPDNIKKDYDDYLAAKEDISH